MPVDSTAIATSTLYPATPWIEVVLPSPTVMIYGTSHPDIWYHAASAQYESGLALKRHGCRILKMYWTDYHVDDDQGTQSSCEEDRRLHWRARGRILHDRDRYSRYFSTCFILAPSD